MDNHKERRYVTVKEAAEICGVSRRTIYGWIKEGYIEVPLRTPSGAARLDKTKLLSSEYKQHNRHVENLKNGL
jgi:excisionase family DNA binding protein